LPTKHFDWDKIPSKPFDIGVPYALKQELPKQPLDWNSLPESNFNLDSLPKDVLIVEIKPLGKPKIVKSSLMVTAANASRGVFTADINFGFLGNTRALLKDKNEMLWMGTDSGLVKYDSENVFLYGVEQGLNPGNIFSMLLDSKGRIWLGTNQKTTMVIDLEAELIYNLSSKFESGVVYDLIEAEDGKFWLCNNGVGYDIIDLEENTIQQFNVAQGLLGEFSITPFQDKNGLVWLSTNKGINIIDQKAGKIKTLTSENGLLGDFAYTFYQDKKDQIWIGNLTGTSIISPLKTDISYFTEKVGLKNSQGISYIYQDSSNKYWLGSDNGLLFSFSEESNMLEKFVINTAGNQILFNIVEDQQGEIWTAAVQGGLYKIDPNSGKPGNYTKSSGLMSSEVWSTLEAKDGKIWIGSVEGIDVYDPKTQSLKSLSAKEGLFNPRSTRLMEDSKGRIWSSGLNAAVSIIDPKNETIQHITTEQGLPTNRIAAIFEAQNGEIWMGGRDGELIKLDQNDVVFNYTLVKEAETPTQNNFFFQDFNGEIWIGTLNSGIVKLNPKNNTFARLSSTEGLSDDRVYSLTADKDLNIWTATQIGVQKIDIEKKELTTFTTNEGLAANDVYAIITKNNKIYTGTSQGLTILSPPNSSNNETSYWQVKSLGKRQGLDQVDFSENSFTFDQNGRFWAGVNGQILTVIDEIKTDTTIQPAHITGINILDEKYDFKDYSKIEATRKALDSTWLPKNDSVLSLKNIKNAMGTIQWETVEGPYNLPVQLTLSPTENYLSFNFNAQNFSNPDKLVYRYFLEGIDKNWSAITDKTTSENYRDLPHGDYTFKVASKGFDNIWSKPASFQFTILPPWWQTWWAYVGYLIILAFFARLLHKYQKAKTVRIEREKSREKELAQAKEIEKAYTELKATQFQLIQSEKMASLGELTAGIAHEIQNPLNFVNNFSEVNTELIDEMQEELKAGNQAEAIEISNDIRDNQQKINHHGKRADAIVKGMLQHSRNNNNEKQLTNINALSDEYLRLAYHGLRAKDKSFNATLNTDFDESIGKINVVGQDIGRVILNLITNAFYATNEKKKMATLADYEPTVTVTTKKINGSVVISVKDNGNGIPEKVVDKIFHPFFTTKPSGEGTGLGLSLSYDIVKVHGGEMKVQTKESEGTEFSILLPITS
jgi:signal transduction histidine kinase/ligand-binding sensor domain-containing protein